MNERDVIYLDVWQISFSLVRENTLSFITGTLQWFKVWVVCLHFQYVLSSGKDSIVKLWELSTSRCLIAYTGAGTTGKQQHRTQAAFNHTEDYGRIVVL